MCRYLIILFLFLISRDLFSQLQDFANLSRNVDKSFANNKYIEGENQEYAVG
jgi:hypothetical protein